MNPAIGALITRLHTGSAEAVQRAILESGLMLEQSNKLEAYQRVLQDPGRLSEMPCGYADRRYDEIVNEYEQYAGEGLMAHSDVGLLLSEEERDALTHALLALVDRGLPPIACDAASAISLSGRLFAIAKLAEFVRVNAGKDDDCAATAIRAIAELMSSRATYRRDVDTAQLSETLDSGLSAIRFAVREGAPGALRARDEAIRQLQRLSERFPLGDKASDW